MNIRQFMLNNHAPKKQSTDKPLSHAMNPSTSRNIGNTNEENKKEPS